MKLTDTYLENRIDSETVVEESEYIAGLLWVIKTLLPDLREYLIEEGRYFGIMLKYSEKVEKNISTILSSNDENEGDENEAFQKLLFLYKPFILQEYKKLIRKKMSCADALIVIIHRMLNVLSENDSYQFHKELKRILSVFNKLHDNIRHSAKKSIMYNFINYLRIYFSNGTCGKFPLKTWSIRKELADREKENTDLVGSGIRLDTQFDNKVSEISWTDDK